MADSKKKVSYKYGQDELDMEKYLHNLGTNVLSYIKSLNWTPDQVLEFLNAYQNYMGAMLDQLKNGTSRFSTDDMGAIIDADGKFNNQDSDNFYYDPKGNKITLEEYDALKDSSSKGLFKKKSNHKDHYKGFDANRQVASYFNQVASGLRDKIKIKKEDLGEFSTALFGKAWQNEFNPAGEGEWQTLIDDDAFDEKTGKRSRTNRLKKLGDFTDSWLNNLDESRYTYLNGPFKDGADARARISAFRDAVKSGDWSAIQDTARNAGIDSKWLNNYLTENKSVTQEGEESSESKEPTEEDIRKKFRELGIAEGYSGDRLNQYVDLQLQGLYAQQDAQLKLNLDQLDEYAYNNWLTSYKPVKDGFINNIGVKNLSNLAMGEWTKSRMNQALVGYLTASDKNAYMKNILSRLALATTDKNLHLINIGILRNWSAANGSKKIKGTNEYYLPWTIDDNEKSVYTYDADHGYIRRRSTLNMDNDEIKAGLRNSWKASKHQQGGSINAMNDAIDVDALIKEKKAKLLAAAKEARNKVSKIYDLGRSKERNKEGRRELSNELRATDIVRFGAIAADTASAIASLLPGAGQTVGLATGIAGTIGNLTADMMDDSVSAWDTAKNLGFGLAMDAAGVIPIFGAAGKTGKIARTVKLLAPLALAAWGTSKTYKPATLALNKLLSEDLGNMTVDDWKALAYGLQAVAGAANSVKGVRNYRKFTEKVNVGSNKKLFGHELPKSAKDVRQLRKISGPMSRDEQLFRKYATEGIKTPKWWQRFAYPQGVPSPRTITPSNTPVTITPRAPLGQGINTNIGVPIPVRTGPVPRPTINPQVAVAAGIKHSPAYTAGISRGLNPTQLARLGIRYKKGGNIDKLRELSDENKVPFYLGGSPITYRRKLSDLVDVDQFSYKADYDPSRGLFAGDTTNGLTTAYQSKTKGNDDFRYAPTSDMSEADVTLIEGQKAYTDFSAALESNEELRKEFYRQSDLYLPEGSKARFLKDDNTSGSPWLAKNNDYRNRPSRGAITNDLDYLRWTRTDGTLGPRHNIFGKFGKRYFYKGADGLDHYVSGDDLSGFKVSDKAVRTFWDKDRGTQWEDYEITEIPEESKTEVVPGEKNPTESKPLTLNEVNPTLKHAIPRAVWADLVNREIRDMSKANERPLLKNVNQMQRRQFGDLRALMSAQNAKGDLMNQMSVPTTSDAALAAQQRLEATLQGNKLLQEGRAKDDEMQRSTAEAAWQLEKANLAERNEVADFNKQSMLQTLYNKGAHDIAYKNKQHEIFDTLWLLIEYEDRLKYNENKAYREQANDLQTRDDIFANPENHGLTREEADLYKSVLNGDQSASALLLKDPEKYKLLLQAQRKYNTAMTRGKLAYHGIRYSGPTYQQSGWSGPVYSEKKGGKLSDGAKILVAKIRERVKNGDRFQKGVISYLKRNQKDIDRLSKSMYGYPKLK